MAVQYRSTLPYACKQVYHPWCENCVEAAWLLTVPSFRESFKVYSVLYAATSIIKLRKVRTLKQLRELLIGFATETIQSTIFLGTHGMFFLPVCCGGRRLCGHLSYYKLYFQVIFCTFPAILIERKQRRGALALYMANLAVEVLFKMAIQRKMFTPLHNGEILIFAIASAIYTFILKTTSDHKHNNLLFSVIRSLVGKEECAPSVAVELIPKPKQKSVYFALLYKLIKNIKRWPRIQNKNQPICTHKYRCFLHVLLGFIKRFLAGVLIQFILHFTSSPLKFLRHPTHFFATLTKSSFDLAKFLGLYSAIYRAVSCLLRNILKYDRPEHGLLAGYLAGFSMLFYKSSTLAMYITGKLLESIYFKAAHDGKVPIIRHFDSLLYSLSTALVLHAAVVEPHVMRPGYYRFLARLTGGYFSQVNRPMMDSYGVCSSKMFPNYKLPSIN
ncbi:unnamed protein product [Rotaria socialis]|uniref:Transmembrane protein 135 N-terminal domain-containing protein n=1 Tax=Rotaria socialis TaxID=392032 RepID=A0A818MRC6_9BILA|nr:unnamed protein product [Rotaria socialis]CAF4313871.1 unnamed protein product [Rotaria socialis]